MPFSLPVARRDILTLAVSLATSVALASPLALAQPASGAVDTPPSVTVSQDLKTNSKLVATAVNNIAATALETGRTTAQAAVNKVDATTLNNAIAALDGFEKQDSRTVNAEVSVVQHATRYTAGELAVYEQQQAEAAAAAAAAAEAARQAIAAANTPDGARSLARTMAANQYGWGDDQFQCLNSLWTRESNWNYQAYNGGSGAAGIPQALPGSKMASAGSDWATNAATQISWGLGYIARSYGTPCAAWGHSESSNWY